MLKILDIALTHPTMDTKKAFDTVNHEILIKKAPTKWHKRLSQ